MRRPMPAKVPKFDTLDVAASYRSARMGGDYFEFLHVAPGRLLLVLLDIAGDAHETMPVAAEVQDVLHARGRELFAPADVNEADALADLVLEMNRTILREAGGVRHTPAFVGCYNEAVGVLTYINAGHTPGLLKDADSVDLLPASGLPLGLFSHSTHDAQIAAMPRGAMVLLVSRGLIEVRSSGEEFGLERLREYLRGTSAENAARLCEEVLQQVSEFAQNGSGSFLGRILSYSGSKDAQNDVTAVALARRTAAAAATKR